MCVHASCVHGVFVHCTVGVCSYNICLNNTCVASYVWQHHKLLTLNSDVCWGLRCSTPFNLDISHWLKCLFCAPIAAAGPTLNKPNQTPGPALPPKWHKGTQHLLGWQCQARHSTSLPFGHRKWSKRTKHSKPNSFRVSLPAYNILMSILTQLCVGISVGHVHAVCLYSVNPCLHVVSAHSSSFLWVHLWLNAMWLVIQT